MEPQDRLWRDDFERDVQSALDDLRKTPSSKEGASGLVDSIIPPAGVHVDLKSARDRLTRMEALALELRKKLEGKAQELDAELRARDRLKDMVVKLNIEVRKLQEAAQLARGREEGSSARVLAIAVRLKESERARQEAVVAVEEERSRTQAAMAHAHALSQKLEDLRLSLDMKESEIQSLASRHEALRAADSERLADWEARGQEAAGEASKLRGRISELEASLRAQEDLGVRAAQDSAQKAGELEGVRRELREARILVEAKEEENRALTEKLEVERSERVRQAVGEERGRSEFQAKIEALQTEQARLQAELKQVRVFLQAKEEENRALTEKLELERSESVRQAVGEERGRSEFQAKIETLLAEQARLQVELREAGVRAEAACAREAKVLAEVKQFEADCLLRVREQMAGFLDDSSRLHEGSRAAIAQAAKAAEAALEDQARVRRQEETARQDLERETLLLREEAARLRRQTEEAVLSARGAEEAALEGLKGELARVAREEGAAEAARQAKQEADRAELETAWERFSREKFAAAEALRKKEETLLADLESRKKELTTRFTGVVSGLKHKEEEAREELEAERRKVKEDAAARITRAEAEAKAEVDRLKLELSRALDREEQAREAMGADLARVKAEMTGALEATRQAQARAAATEAAAEERRMELLRLQAVAEVEREREISRLRAEAQAQARSLQEKWETDTLRLERELELRLADEKRRLSGAAEEEASRREAQWAAHRKAEEERSRIEAQAQADLAAALAAKRLSPGPNPEENNFEQARAKLHEERARLLESLRKEVAELHSLGEHAAAIKAALAAGGPGAEGVLEKFKRIFGPH